ncbi:hypothetical protein [Sporomusa aerivorans]|uniref:hypothetical protein n=1 Tax=Sporomusa aerivorans TaxID=204936 RepID=UPI00352B9A1E
MKSKLLKLLKEAVIFSALFLGYAILVSALMLYLSSNHYFSTVEEVKVFLIWVCGIPAAIIVLAKYKKTWDNVWRLIFNAEK